MKIQTRKGFTLTELLIVMAIIVVLAAVAVPTFGKQLETSRETGDMEIIRNAYTEALSIAILDAADGKINGKLNNGTEDAASDTTSWEYVSFKANSNDLYYEVDLQAMNAAFSQRKYNGASAPEDNRTNRQAAWKYVTSTFMNRTVPIVDTEQIKLQFRFKILTNADIAAGAGYAGKDYTVGDVVLILDPTADDNSTDTFAIEASAT